MTPRSSRAAGASLAAALLLLSGCTGDSPAARSSASPTPPPATAAPAPALRLVSYSDCADALAKLKAAAKEHVGPWGFGDFLLQGGGPAAGAFAGRSGLSKANGDVPADTNYSGTNTHEAGVDEPDIVKTDGRRIVTMSQGVLKVVDAARRQTVGTLRIASDSDGWGWDAQLLLHGDRALVLINGGSYKYRGRAIAGVAPDPFEYGSRLLLVELSGAPRVLAEYGVDGGLVDARQVGDVARVVVRSTPRVEFPQTKGSDAKRVAANRRHIDRLSAADWLPRYQLTQGGRTTSGQVPCDRLSYPEKYSGMSMLTVLTFGLTGSDLGDGDPVTLMADGDTVYSNGPSLYVATDLRWWSAPWRSRPRPAASITQLYKFDTSGAGRPRYVAGGAVPGWLINQYALSEWDGRLRVATTTEANPRRVPVSAVHVLEQRGGELAVTGKVGGLGRNERIYAVRFVGPVGYVVTFRQTDPLYTLDLSDPARPRAAGELKITGYSAYLHPAGAGRVIGVGQEATTGGRTRGIQVSLFDVTDLTRPTRLAQYHVRDGYSEAEHEPHSFLYWPAENLIVLPLTVLAPNGEKQIVSGGATVLRMADSGFTEVGTVSHPIDRVRGGDGSVRRSLVIDGVLWTVSNSGLKAVSLSGLDSMAWIGN